MKPAWMRPRDPHRPLVCRSRLTGAWRVMLVASPWQVAVLHETDSHTKAMEWLDQAAWFVRAWRHDWVSGADR